MLCLFFIIAYVQADCPQWTCKNLNQTKCATLHGYQIYANILPCPRDYFCKLDAFTNWQVLEAPSSTNTFNCTRQNYGGVDIESLKKQSDFFCGFRDTTQELADGRHPKTCLSNKDCKTIGGWETECLCGLDGFKYCSAEIGSSAFDEYWEKCFEKQGSTHDPKITAVEKAYWDYYYNFYIEIVSAPSCVKSLLWEFSILDDLDGYRKSSFSQFILVSYFFLISL